MRCKNDADKREKRKRKIPCPTTKRGDFVICKNCKKTIPDNANFCKYCGEKTGLICPDCGTELKQGTMFCSSCGRRMRPDTSAAFPEDAPHQFGEIWREPEQFITAKTAADFRKCPQTAEDSRCRALLLSRRRGGRIFWSQNDHRAENGERAGEYGICSVIRCGQ